MPETEPAFCVFGGLDFEELNSHCHSWLSRKSGLSIRDLAAGMMQLFDCRKAEKEGGSNAYCGFGPDRAAMPVHDSFYGCQPYPGSREFFLGVKARKGMKELLGVGHCKPRPIVANNVCRAGLALQHAESYSTMLSLRSVFP